MVFPSLFVKLFPMTKLICTAPTTTKKEAADKDFTGTLYGFPFAIWKMEKIMGRKVGELEVERGKRDFR